MKNGMLKIGMILVFAILILSFASAFMRSDPSYMQFMGETPGTFDNAMCEQGQDFIIQIAPFGCTPAVVRSDLLEEQNVPVFCRLGATQINPLIEVEAIDSISFSGEYPPEVEGIAFHPAQAALGVQGNLNNPILNNIGYVVIVLKRQANASSMPDFVVGNLTARVRYDVKNAFSIGRANFYLPELEDSEWEDEKYRYGFWNNKGYVRAEDIGNDNAVVSIYSGDNKLQTVSLDKGETSEEIYLPGFDCLASLKVKLNSLENPDSRALIRVNADVFEVAKGEKFLDNKCEVTQLKKKGLVQEVEIKCSEDDGVNRFDATISPKVKISIDGVEKEFGVGERIPEASSDSKSVYIGHIGTKGDAKDVNDLFVYLVSMREHRDILTDGELNYYGLVAGELLNVDFKGGIIDKAEDVVKIYAGVYNIMVSSIIRGESYAWVNYQKPLNFWGNEIIVNGFTEPIDSSVIEGISAYQDAVDDYETVIDSFSGEVYSGIDADTFDEEALYQKIVLAWNAQQKRTVVELCGEFKSLYPNSDKNLEEYCDNKYKLSNQEVATNYVTINGETKKIVFDGIYEPSFEDYGAEIFVSGSGEPYRARKNKLIYLNNESDTMQLVFLEQDSARIEISVDGKEKSLTLEEDVSEGYGEYTFTLANINLKKIAKVSVIPSIEDAGTEASFGFRVDIEKRAFQLPPEMIKEKIEKLDAQIGKWGNFSEGMGKTVEALQKACLVTGAGLVFKNFIENAGGTGIARGYVMRGNGGWHEKCADIANKDSSISMDECLLDNADEIDGDVDRLSNLIDEQNTQIKELEKGITETDVFGTDVVDADALMERHSNQFIGYWDDSFPDSFADPDGFGESINREEMITILEGWEDRNYNQEQLREIELWAKVLKDDDASSDLQDLAEREFYSVLFDVKENAGDYVERINFADETGMGSSSLVASFEELNEISITERKTFGQTKYTGSINSEDYVFSFKDSGTGEKYLLVYDEDGVVQSTYTIGEGNVLTETEKQNPLGFFFKQYDSSSYENEYKRAKLKYYETEPYKGRPAIVPFDLDDGWYAATKQTLPVLGNIRAFDDSGAVSSFYLCNVGENGLEENIGGDDDCVMVNRRTGPFDQFPGLNENEAEKVVGCGFDAIDDASRAHKSGVTRVKISTNCGSFNVDVGAPAADVPGMQCQDFMSPTDCQILFNVCDPVICPSSRCDLNGAYPVKDVIQSGIIGSLLLCLPNMDEGILMPVCLTGVKAGIDGWLSVQTSYRDCLQHSLDTGEMMGVCDEIHSIYICEFFWRQALPLADIIIPKLIGGLFGQNVRGGGEYLTVVDAWAGAKDSVSYFTQYYGANSFSAFKSRSTEEVGGEICKLSVSGVLPTGADLLDTLSEPASPVQFHGRFDEIPFSSATVPPTSHYKVFYHIFAGKNEGAYYQVYLKGIPGSSYYQDVSSTLMIASGYIGVGEYAEETRDLTEAEGYQQLCINVNGQEECGFKEVSTSFAVDYISDVYVASQITDTDIKTEQGCISGTIFGQETITPGDYNYGIVRTCATGNPGIGSDAYAGTENSRWRQVGYCGDENIGCWLDTESVKDIIEGEKIAGDALEDVTGDYLALLRDEGNYLSKSEFNSKVKEISKHEGDATKQLVLIDEIFNKVFLNKEKAQMYLLRGNAYANIAGRLVKEELEKRKTAGEDEDGEKTEPGEEGDDELNLDDLETAERIFEIAKDYADRKESIFRIDSDGDEDYENVCARFVGMVLVDAGIDTPGIEIEEGPCDLDAIDNMIELFDDTEDFVEVDMNKLKEGDVVVSGKQCELTEHVTIFSYYKNNKHDVYAYGAPGGRRTPVKLQAFTLDSPNLYVYRAFRYTGGGGTSDEVEEREAWTFDSAILEINDILQNSDKRNGGKYLDNIQFIDELLFDGVIDKGECIDFRGIDQWFGAEDMAWLKEKLLEKTLDVKKNLVDLEKAVVKIRLVTENTPEPLSLETYAGTGFLIEIPEEISPDLQMITALHTLDENITEGGYGYFEINSGKTFTAQEMHRDEDLDFLFLGTVVGRGESFHLDLGDSNSLRVGDKVFAIGIEEGSEEVQILESNALELPSSSNDFKIWIERSSIGPGFSGGPVVDISGDVIGMIILINRGEDVAILVPINDIKESLEIFLSQFD